MTFDTIDYVRYADPKIPLQRRVNLLLIAKFGVHGLFIRTDLPNSQKITGWLSKRADIHCNAVDRSFCDAINFRPESRLTPPR